MNKIITRQELPKYLPQIIADVDAWIENELYLNNLSYDFCIYFRRSGIVIVINLPVNQLPDWEPLVEKRIFNEFETVSGEKYPGISFTLDY